MALSNEGRERLVHGAQTLGIDLTIEQVELLDRYLYLVEETNRHTNLTRITGDDAVTGHFLDALSLASVIPLRSFQSLIDVGTGLGVPGVVLKIVFPHLEVVLLDSLKKRVTFLEQTIEAMKIPNVRAIHMRAEDAGRDPKLRERFDICVSRAVASLYFLSEYSMPLIKQGGLFVAYKGNLDQEELAKGREHIKALGGDKVRVESVTVPGLDAARVLVTSQKSRKTPSLYPRTSSALAKEKL